MIDLKDALLIHVVVVRLSQPTSRDSAAVVAACSLRSVRMPGAAQAAVGQSSAEIRRQMLVVVLIACDSNAMTQLGSVNTNTCESELIAVVERVIARKW